MGKILIIDDSRFSRSILVKLLTEMEIDSVQVDSGQNGLNKINEEKFDCILLDLLMEGLSGIEVLSQLVNDQINIPVIIITADIQKKIKIKCLELGAADFLSKPINKEDLRGSLKKVLKNADNKTT